MSVKFKGPVTPVEMCPDKLLKTIVEGLFVHNALTLGSPTPYEYEKAESRGSRIFNQELIIVAEGLKKTPNSLFSAWCTDIFGQTDERSRS